MSLRDDFKIPHGWATSLLPDLIGSSGLITDGDWVESKDQDPDGNVRLIQLADVGDSVFRDRSSRYLTSEKAEELRCTILQLGDILVARMPDPLGRACQFPKLPTQCVTVVDVCIIRPDQISNSWLMYTINAPAFRAAIAILQSGSTRKRISKKNLCTIKLPVAPSQEQHRIVDALESHLSRLDDAVASLERVQSKLKQYRASVLKAAVEGRLVPTEAELARSEGREYEPASELLKRILEEHRRKWIEDAVEKGRSKVEEKATKAGKLWSTADDQKALEKERIKAEKKYKEPAAAVTDELPELPDGWRWGSLEALCPVFVDCAHRTPKYSQEGIPALRPRDVVHGKLNLDSVARVPENEFIIQTARRIPQQGDLIYSRELSFGWAIEVPTDPQVCMSQGMVLFRPGRGILNTYFLAALNGPLGRRQAEKIATGSSHPHLNLTEIRAYSIPVAPTAEQTRIVERLSDILSIIDVTERDLIVQIRKCHVLRQSILKWAFEGKLVDQDPDDEPASVLLERIKAERGAMEAEKKKSSTRARRVKT